MRVVHDPNTDLNSVIEAQQNDIQMLKLKLDETTLYHKTAMSNLRRDSSQLIAHTQRDDNKSRKRMKAYYINHLRIIEAKLHLTTTNLECNLIHSKEMKSLVSGSRNN